uniref:ORF1ab polyprotein n=1 Tax=Bird deltacoronavirus CalidrisCN24 TaxID=3237949 RepID=A0AB39AFZ8_9NIDO
MAPKAPKRKDITLPETLSGPLHLFLSVAAADEGHPNDLTFLGGYTIRRGNVIPGVQAIDNKIKLNDFEVTFGPQPSLRAIRNLLDEAKISGWDKSKETLALKAKSLLFSDDVLRAMIKHGTQRISSLASLALFYRTIAVEPIDLLKLAETVAIDLAHAGKFNKTMAAVKAITLEHKDSYLTLNERTMAVPFTNSLTTSASSDNGALTYSNIRLWPRCAAIQVDGVWKPLASTPLESTSSGSVEEDVNLLPDYNQLPVNNVTGITARVHGFDYIKTDSKPPLYYPSVEGGVLNIALKQQGTQLKTMRVVFHTKPDDVLTAFIHLQAILAKSPGTVINIEDNEFEVGHNTQVVFGTSKPGDVVVSSETEYLNAFNEPEVALLYKLFRTEPWAVLHTKFRKLNLKVSKAIDSLILFLERLGDFFPKISALIATAVNSIKNLTLDVLAKVSKVTISYKAGSLIVDSTAQIAKVLTPLIEFLQPFLTKFSTFATYASGKFMVMFTTTGAFVLEKVKVYNNKLTYLFHNDAKYPVKSKSSKIVELKNIKPVDAVPEKPLEEVHVLIEDAAYTFATDGQHYFPSDGVTADSQAFKAGADDSLKVTFSCDVFDEKTNAIINESLVAYELDTIILPRDTTPRGIAEQCVATLTDAITDYHPEWALNMPNDLQVCSSHDDLPLALHHIPDKLQLYIQAADGESSDEELIVDEEDLIPTVDEDDDGAIPTCWVVPEIPSFKPKPVQQEILVEEEDDVIVEESESEEAEETDEPTAIPEPATTKQEESKSDNGQATVQPVEACKAKTEPSTSKQEESKSDNVQVAVQPVEDCKVKTQDNTTPREEVLPQVAEPQLPVEEQIVEEKQDSDTSSVTSSETESTSTAAPIEGDAETIITDSTEQSVDNDDLLPTVVGEPITLESHIPDEAKIESSETKVELVVGDIKKLTFKNAVLVNPANEHLKHGGGAAAAIADIAGPDYVKYCDTKAPFSGVLVTKPYNAAKFGYACILHVVPPRGSDPNVQEKLYQAYRSILTEPAHYVIPILGAGIFGCNPVHSLDAFRKACPPNIGKVTLLTMDARHLQVWDTMNRVVVQTTKDFEQVTTQHLTKQGVLDANLFDGSDYVLEPEPTKVYLSVDQDVQNQAKMLDLTVAQYYKYLKNIQCSWKTKKTRGIIHLVQQSNNCFVSAALNLYQKTHYVPREAINSLYQEYLNGNPSRLVAWIYASINQSIGEMGCPQQVLTLLLSNSGAICQGVTTCCKTHFTHDGPVVSPKDFDVMQAEVYCLHCNKMTTFTPNETQGVVAIGRTKAEPVGPCIMFSQQAAHCWYTDGKVAINASSQPGDIVAVYHSFAAKPVKTSDLAKVFATENKFSVLKQDPEPKKQDLTPETTQPVTTPKLQDNVPKGTVVLENPDVIDLLDVWITKPVAVLVKSWTVIGKTIFTAGKITWITGKILYKIYNYLVEIGVVDVTAKISFNLACKFVKAVIPRSQTIKRIALGTMYSLKIILVTLAPFLLIPAVVMMLKSGYVIGSHLYAKTGIPCNYHNVTPLDIASYCSNQPLTCPTCFEGYDSLHYYNHLRINAVKVSDTDYVAMAIVVILFLANTTLAVITSGLVLAFNAYSLTLPYFGTVTLDYMNTIYFAFFMRYFVALLCFLRHMARGCKSPDCAICARIKVAPTITVETVVQGRKYPSVVNTNGGSKVCTKHNFYCDNCDSDTPGTFIPVEAVESLSKATRLSVKSTAPAYVLARDVECQTDVLVARAHGGASNSMTGANVCVARYSDVRTVDQLLKPTPLASYTSDVIIAADFDNSGSLKTAKELAVVISMDLKRTVFIIDQQYSKPVDTYTEVCAKMANHYTFNKITETGDVYADVKSATDNQATDSAINAAILAVQKGLEFTIDEPNHILPHYAFDMHQLSTEDQQVLGEMNCVKGNLKGTNVGVILTANLVSRISHAAVRAIANAASRNGVTCAVTPSTRVLRGNIATQPFPKIKAGAAKSFRAKLFKIVVIMAACYALAYAMQYAAAVISDTQPPTHKSDMRVNNFYVIRDGVLDTIRAEDDCFANKFLEFDTFMQRPYKNSRHCPVVVGVAAVTPMSIPGIPAGVIQRDGLILHVYDSKNLFEDALSKVILNIGDRAIVGYTQNEVVVGNSFMNSPALFNSKCTYLMINGETTLYCFEKVNTEHKLYSDVIPHTEYTAIDVRGEKTTLKIPEQILYYPHVVKYTSNSYCRMGHCFTTNPGICVSFTDVFPTSNNEGPGVYCGADLLGLFSKITLGAVTGMHVFTSTAALCASTIVIIICVMVVLTTQRLFKEYTTFVMVTIFVALLNVIGVFIIYKALLLAIPYYGVYTYFALTLSPVKRNIAFFYMLIVLLPHATNMQILACIIVGLLYFLYNYVYTVSKTGGKFTSFLDASKSTFIIDNDKYVILKDLAGADYDTYLASYAKYKYFSGTASDKDYDNVCKAFLAKAMASFREGGGTQLYTPPKLAVVQSMKAKLQAGVKILLHPSGMVERCITSVTYNGSTLNGVWLHNIVYCPRHVIGKYSGDQWQHMASIADCRDFIISCPNQGIQLTVQSIKMVGAILQLTVHAKNQHTPKYEFTRIKPGASMSIACAYDGIVRNIYHVVLQSNNLIYASFLNGACGSVGYSVQGTTLHLHYMHHIEFNNQTHGGTDLNGVFYGPYVDEERAQAQIPMQMYTDNVIAQIYAHILTVQNKPSWLAKTPITDTEFNTWAANNSFCNYPCDTANQAYIAGLAQITGVSVGCVLNTIVNLTLNRNGAVIMGHPDFESDWTPSMVYNQAPINLQSRIIVRGCIWLTNCAFNAVLVAIALLHILPNDLYPLIVPISCTCGFFISLTIKHTVVFLTTFLLPTLVMLVAVSPTLWIPNNYLRALYEWAMGYGLYESIATYSVLGYMAVYTILAINVCLMSVRYRANSMLDACIYFTQLGYLSTIIYRIFTEKWTVYLLYRVLSMMSSHPFYGTFCWFISGYIHIPFYLPDILIRILLYLFMGYVSCMRFGLFWVINKFFNIPIGTYKYMVSMDQLKYMMATKMPPPRNAFEVIITNMRLLGIGGKRVIAISRLQNKVLDAKATAVIVANLLEKAGVTNKHAISKKIVKLHNDILKATTFEEAETSLVQLLTHIIEFLPADQVDEYLKSTEKAGPLNEYLDNLLQHKPVLQVVADNNINLDSYRIYKEADAAYRRSLELGEPLQEQKRKLKAVNIAKSEWERDAASQRKLEKLADAAMKSMYLAERAEDRRIKLTSGLTAMLYHMLRRIDSDKVKALFECAKSAVVPIHAVVGSSSEALKVIINDKDSYDKYVVGNTVIHKGVTYNINKTLSLDNAPVDGVPTEFPIVVECTRAGTPVLQNNELCLRNVFTAQAVATDINGKEETTKSFYVTRAGKKVLVAVTSSKDNLQTVVCTTENGKVVLDLDPPMRFAHSVGNKQNVVYLYFIRNINSLNRGMVIGHISSTTILQATGTSIEYQENASLLTYLAFAVNPKEAYLKHIADGGKPIQGVVQMIATMGPGFAVTTKPQPNDSQYAYGGASICLYCRAHITHPGVDGRCPYKGRFVHIDKDQEPVSFALTHEPCNSCQRWVNYDCTCGTTLQNSAYLNRVKGTSAARLEPLRDGTTPDTVKRAFNVHNNVTSGIFVSIKTNCARFKTVRNNLPLPNKGDVELFFVTKQCSATVFSTEEAVYNKFGDEVKTTDVHFRIIAKTEFFKFDKIPNVNRHHLTKYTVLDLAYAIRHLSTSREVIKEILITYCGTSIEWFDDQWYDPIENPTFYSEIHKLGPILNRCVLNANKFAYLCKEKGLVGILTPDNQDLLGQIYDFGDFVETQPGNGCVDLESYYSYLMPLMSMTHMLKCELFTEDGSYKEYDAYQYDYTEYKVTLFKKYFAHWSRPYHPNTVDCPDDRCVLHCANFNILFAMCIPNTAFGNLCSKATVDGHLIVQTVGVHLKELGIVFNKDVNASMTNINLNTLLRLVGDPTTHAAVADKCIDLRTPCQTLATISSGITKQSVKPGHFNNHFYKHLIDSNILSQLDIDIRHFYYMQDGEAAIKDYSYYRYNTPTMVDIKMFLFCLEVADKYLDGYDGGCLNAQSVVVNNLDKSAGYPFNKLGKARNYYDMSYNEQNQLFEYTKRNVLPTLTQMNLKYAISAKDRARTVAGVSIISTMTNRQYHQKLLKSISLARNQTIVIGTTKFYGGWDNMLRRLMNGINNPVLVGWDYPKCDRSMPNILRIASSCLLARKHTCCNQSQRFYRLANECCQVLSEVVISGNNLYVKPGGTSSGDATTAYANSVFNILQVVTANVASFLSTSTTSHDIVDVANLHRELYETIYRGDSNDTSVIDNFHKHLSKYFGLMILSDDGVACIDTKAAEKGMVANLDGFRDVLFYQNNVFMADSKCWTETDMTVGPHEFCSQHTVLAEHEGRSYYLPYPDVSRILGACIFVDDVNKADPVQNLERYISLAIDAYPLTKVSPAKGKVFYLLLDYIKVLAQELQSGILDSFQAMTDMSYVNNFVQESFYAQMYEQSPTLQASGVCVVCNSPTILRCGDCIRRPLLCCVCCYQHVTRTDHKRVIAINNYICSVDNCNEDNVEKLYISGTAIFCESHKPTLCIPIVANGSVFGIYRHTAKGSDDIELFNMLATSDFSTVEPYQKANRAPISLMLFAAETIKAREESIKKSYASATVRDVYDQRIIKLVWEQGKKPPPITKNHIFTGYHFNKNGKTQVGDYILSKCDGGDSYTYKGTSTYRLQTGDVLVLMAHVVTPLSAPPVLAQTNYTRKTLIPDSVKASFYVQHFKAYNDIALQKVTTVLGPPGTGKSTFAIGLAKYFPNARICYTASSHAAIDALCDKAFKTLPVGQCSRIVPTRTTVECFQDFVINNTTSQYIFSTINALPDIKCDIVVVDEISMLTNYELSSVNARLVYNHIVYVGDPYQLPSPRTMLTTGQLAPADYNVVTDIMVHVGADVMLDTCYRCPKEIVDTVSKLVYDNKLKAAKPSSRQCFKTIVNYGPSDIGHEGQSAYNEPQLQFALAFRKYKRWDNVTFISPYNAMNVKAAMAGFSTQTVDSSQGSEYDYVIFCVTTDSGHALNMSRLNVALTRAKVGILVVFRQANELYNELQFEAIEPSLVGQEGVLPRMDRSSTALAKSESTLVKTQGTEGKLTPLFKRCGYDYKGVHPAHALTWHDVGADYKCEEPLAKLVGVTDGTTVSYKALVSALGFLPSLSIETYHSMFITKDACKQYAQSWIGIDVEAAHAVKPNVGTNLPLQVGFSTGVNFSVVPEGIWVDEHGTCSDVVPAKIPPGDQFKHLRKDMKYAKPWSIVRFSIVQHIAETIPDTDHICFITWAHQLELATMRYFVKIGPEQICNCGRRAVFTDGTNYGCKAHYSSLNYVYNPFVVDVATWGYTGSLSSNHDVICTYHANAHVASSDAEMTICVAIHHLFSTVDWTLEFPVTPEQNYLNKACRLVQANYLNIMLTTTGATTVHDIGNPKGIPAVRKAGVKYSYYDKNPLVKHVSKLCYKPEMESRFEGLTMFWNCNVDVYPANALVCRYDTHKQKHLIGPNGSALYINKHAFLTPEMHSYSTHKLRLAPLVYYSTTDCSNEQPIVVSYRDCVTRCNTGTTICSVHALEYQNFIQAYNMMSKHGFNVYVPRNINLYNCWLTFANLQTLENLAYNCYYKNCNAHTNGTLDVVINNNAVYARVDNNLVKLFDNRTNLPVSVAFEHYSNRHTKSLPTTQLLSGLGVTATRNFTIWKNEDSVFFHTINVSTYTDCEVDNHVVLCDDRYGTDWSQFNQFNNAVFLTQTKIKKAEPITVTALTLNNVPIENETLYVYVRRNGVFINQSTLFTQGRQLANFTPRSKMEQDFINMQPSEFITLYGLESLGVEHIFYGDDTKPVIGGTHSLISIVRSKFECQMVEHIYSPVQNCVITSTSGSSKDVCSVVDLLLDDYVELIKNAHKQYSTKSKVFSVVIDMQKINFMLWHSEKDVQTCYPIVQALTNGYQMPSIYKTLVTELEPCDIPNYHAYTPRVPGVVKNVIKYRQLFNYIVKKDRMAVPHNMTVLHLGAASHMGTAPGSSVIKQMLPEGTVLIDLDIREFTSDANQCIVLDYRTYMPPHHVDAIFSDLYACDDKHFFDNLIRIVKERLALGGSIFIKVTEHSYSPELYELAGHFDEYQFFCTAVNAASSEAFLCCFNYLGCMKEKVDGNLLHASYIRWRNEIALTPTYSPLADSPNCCVKLKATPIISSRELEKKPILKFLVASGRLLVRPPECGELY